MSTEPKKQLLKTEIKDGVLTISIGVEALAFAIEHNPEPGNEMVVTNPEKFAEDVARELNREQEDGTTVVHLMLDRAAKESCEQGSEWVEERPSND